MSDLLVLIQYTTVSINSMSVSYMGKSCLDPSVTCNEILRMCSSMGGPRAPTSRYQMTFLEVSLGTCTQSKQAHWKSRSQLYLFLFQLLYLAIIFFLSPYDFITLNPISSFLQGSWRFDWVAYKWKSSLFVALSHTPFGKHLLRVYTYQPLFLARNNKASLLF